MVKLGIVETEDWIAEEIDKNYNEAIAHGDACLVPHPRALKPCFYEGTGVDFSVPTELAQGLKGENVAALSQINSNPCQWT